jgi:DNA-binding PadR family transcriptional regulator
MEGFGKQPPRQIFSLTAAGRKQLKSELANWRRLSGAIELVTEAG